MSRNEDHLPNIILIMADDMGYECLGAYGSGEYQTPNLDRMAAEGIQFNHFYAQPLCTPSRVKIMTGKYNFRNYTHFGYLDPGEMTIGNILKEKGYKTMVAGKWQLNGLNRNQPGNQDEQRPYEFGFDEYCLWQLTRRRNEGERYADPLIEQNGKLLEGITEKYGPDIFTEYILDFMERNRESRFFIYYPMVLVHEPFVPTPDSEEWESPELRYKKDTTYFADMVAYMDRLVGRIIQKNEELGLAEQTLVLFLADNGTDQHIISDMKNGRKIQGGKGLTIETGIHVPLIAYWRNKVRPGLKIEHLIDLKDILPTIAEVAGIETETLKTDGRSFYPLLLNEPYEQNDQLYQYYFPQWGKFDSAEYVWDHHYKLYRNGNFFRISDDPLEREPLSEAEINAEEKRIKNRLEGFINQVYPE